MSTGKLLLFFPLLSTQLTGGSWRVIRCSFRLVTGLLDGRSFWAIAADYEKQDQLLASTEQRYYDEDRYWRYGVH